MSVFRAGKLLGKWQRIMKVHEFQAKQILREAGGWRVREEVGTLNGTFVNGQRLKPGSPAPFAVGDVLRFGNIDLTVAVEP